jgi:hypothetical protein
MVLEYLKSVGFWPWLILLVVLVIAAGDRIGVIKLPGGGEVNPGRQKSAETSMSALQASAAPSSLDTRLARTDSDISWSLRVAGDGEPSCHRGRRDSGAYSTRERSARDR